MANTTIVFICGYPPLPTSAQTTQTQTQGNKQSIAATAGQCVTAMLSHRDTDSACLFQTEYTKGRARTGVISNLLYKANNLGS